MAFLNERKRKVKPLRASQSLSETFPCVVGNCTAFYLKGEALRGNRVARVGIRAQYVRRLEEEGA